MPNTVWEICFQDILIYLKRNVLITPKIWLRPNIHAFVSVVSVNPYIFTFTLKGQGTVWAVLGPTFW